MRIEITNEKDMRPGSIFRALIQNLLGNDWEDYIVVYVKEYDGPTGIFFSKYKVHNEDGPAAIKRDGTMEWWLNGNRLFCETQQQFECYMRNKAFW